MTEQINFFPSFCLIGSTHDRAPTTRQKFENAKNCRRDYIAKKEILNKTEGQKKQKKEKKSITKNKHKMLTESTDATSETMIMIMEVLKWKMGTPHCKG